MNFREESMKRKEFQNMNTANKEVFFTLLDPTKSQEEVGAIREAVHAQIESMGLGMPDDSMLEKVDYYEEDIAYEYEGRNEKTGLLIIGPKGFKDSKETYPVLFHLHGGALCLLHNKIDFKTNIVEVLKLNCIVVSPNYPLAPEHRYKECMTSLLSVVDWLVENGASYRMDVDNTVIKGNSTGGHLSAALSHRLKERNKEEGSSFQFKAQVLNWPILDDRASYDSSDLEAGGDWNPMNAYMSAKAWLGEDYGRPDLEGWAYPMRDKDFAGLPATFIHANEFDHERDASIAYMKKLLEANTFVEFKLWGGAHHAAQMFTDGEISRDWKDNMRAQVKEAFENDYRRK